MCDTFVALPNYTASGNLIFGKNSDRSPNEAQAIVRIPAQKPKAAKLQCTYIQIPQVKETFEVILSKPFQMWGAEMGLNEHGVVIGNTAVFTKVKMTKKNIGLTGMDLVRLGLERSKSAAAALEQITDLLAQFGQNASGAFQPKKFYYHNSFIIADQKEAWVLETAGKHWVAKQVNRFYSISNVLSIEEDFDLSSENVILYATKRKWRKIGATFNFKKAYSDKFYTRLSQANRRRSLINEMLGEQAKKLSAGEAMGLLSIHNVEEAKFHPSKCTTASICRHATGCFNRAQTTGSMVAEIRKNAPHTIWLTGTSMPCLSVFKPFFFGGDNLMGPETRPSAIPDQSLWWRVEKLHREMAKDYLSSQQEIQAERKALQWDFLYQEWDLIHKENGKIELNNFSNSAFKQYLELLERWEVAIARLGLKQQSNNLLYRFYQNRINNSVYLSQKH